MTMPFERTRSVAQGYMTRLLNNEAIVSSLHRPHSVLLED